MARKKNESRQRVWQRIARTLGLCVTCGRRAAPRLRDGAPSCYCRFHLRYHNNYQRKKYGWIRRYKKTKVPHH